MDRVALDKLDALCATADRVQPLSDLHDFILGNRTIGMRHDVDDNGFDSMLAMAEWEARRGRTSTFYVLHTAPYWNDPRLPRQLQIIQAMGHEIGLHNNALAVWWLTGCKYDPFEIFREALHELRGFGLTIRSTAGHGDDACYAGRFVNYSMFEEAQGSVRAPWRSFEEISGLEPRSIKEFGLDFLGEFVPKSDYVSDSGDRWSTALDLVIFPDPKETKPLVILQHPDWYARELFA
jgi:hypothetical protein